MATGFTFIEYLPISVTAGVQFCFENDYGVTAITDPSSKEDNDTRIEFKTFRVSIIKGPQGEKPEVKTLDVMRRMNYEPTSQEKEDQLIYNVTPSILAKIMTTTSMMEVH